MSGSFGEKPAGPLFGVPVSIKDLIVTKGLRTTFGSLLYEKNVPETDAVLVERLRSAGQPHDREDQYLRVRLQV